jgi:hypothetical protein
MEPCRGDKGWSLYAVGIVELLRLAWSSSNFLEIKEEISQAKHDRAIVGWIVVVVVDPGIVTTGARDRIQPE